MTSGTVRSSSKHPFPTSKRKSKSLLLPSLQNHSAKRTKDGTKKKEKQEKESDCEHESVQQLKRCKVFFQSRHDLLLSRDTRSQISLTICHTHTKRLTDELSIRFQHKARIVLIENIDNTKQQMIHSLLLLYLFHSRQESLFFLKCICGICCLHDAHSHFPAAKRKHLIVCHDNLLSGHIT